jgi:thiamine-phosphate pyrophosphorylase
MNPPPGPAFRVLDANLNRAREAFRVLEDYARFILDSKELSAQLKDWRHELVTVTKPWAADAIQFRNTIGDVGTGNKTATEFERADVADVVIAAGKRLGEALRSIEEFAKTIDKKLAADVEYIRYRFYDIEQVIAGTLRPANRFAAVRLYVLITESACRRPWLDVAMEAIKGGAECLQLREKDLEGGELLKRARQMVAICRPRGIISIINDRPDIAILSGADGVHVGQGDLPATEARKIVGRERIVGVSTHSIEQAKQAVLDGADYIGVGPVFASATKPREILPGLAYARQVAEQIKIPAIAIAGIDERNVDEVISAGLSRIAVTAAVTGCDEVRDAAVRLKSKLIGAERQM